MTLTANNTTLIRAATAIVAGVTAEFAQGRVTAIIGPNGAGKTSLAKLLTGLIVPDSGSVSIDGENLFSLTSNQRARRIGYLAQSGEPQWNVKVRDLVSLGRLPHMRRHASLSATDQTAIDAALTATAVAPLADRTIDTLSGGELARAKFARVLCGEPEWIVADEPLASLDPAYARDTARLLRAAAHSGAGVIVVLHDLTLAATLADDIIMMRSGRIVAAGKRADVLTAPLLAQTFGIQFDIAHIGDRAIIAAKQD